jgi:phage terminase large subunit-like protein
MMAARAKSKKRPARVVSHHERDVLDYCEDVQAGAIVAGKLVKAAVERFLRDLKSGPSRGLMFDYDAANRAIDFVQLLKHSTGEFRGRPFRLEPWQKFIFWNLFGWKWAATGLRRFRESFLSMGRGNGKSPLAAAILNCLLFLDGEARAELVIAAVERDQARIVFRETCGQVKSNPTLKKRCDFWKNSLVYRSPASTVVPLGKEAESKDGMNLHGFVADEVHAWK